MNTSHRQPHGEKPSNDEIDYLLSGGRLGGSQREKIWRAVVETVRRRGDVASRRWRIAAMSTALATAAASFLLWNVHAEDQFRSKDSSDPAALSLDVSCLRAALRSCPRGSLLAFSARGASPDLFVTAYLEPLHGDAPVWLLFNESSVAADAGLLPRGALIAQDQPPGDYRIRLTVTRHPLPRRIPPLQSVDFVATAQWELTIVP